MALASIRNSMTVIAAAMAVMLTVSLPWRGQAQDIETYTVRGVAVDRTAANPTQARDSAHAEGRRVAFRRLMERLVPPEARGRVASVNDEQLLDLIHSFEVDNERSSAVRYAADLTVIFNPDAVSDLLARSGVAASAPPPTPTGAPAGASAPRPPLVVLPVFRAAGGLQLWEDANPWRLAWLALPSVDSSAPLLVPLGDLSDIANVDADKAMAGNEAAIAAITRRYGAAGALVAVARPRSPDPARQVIEVSLDVRGVAGERNVVESFTGRPGESLEALLARAAAETRRGFEERARRPAPPTAPAPTLPAAMPAAGESVINVMAPVAGVAELVSLRQRLSQVAGVKRNEVVSLSRRQAVIELAFSGDPQRLSEALAQRDLVLARDGEGWRLTTRGGPARP